MQSQFLRVVTEIMVPEEWFVAGEILLGVEFLQQRPLRLYLLVHFFFMGETLFFSLSIY